MKQRADVDFDNVSDGGITEEEFVDVAFESEAVWLLDVEDAREVKTNVVEVITFEMGGP